MKAQIFAAVLLLGTSGLALAADPGMPMEQPPVGFNWTGGYVGVQGGYAWGDAHQFWVGDTDYSNPDPDGWFGGLYAGYNHQFVNNVVVGVDVDVAWGGMDSTETFYDNGVPDPNFQSLLDVNWTAALRGRLGYAVDRWLPYLAGGVALANVDWKRSNGVVEDLPIEDTYVGWTLGVGTEYAFTDTLLGRIEYRYSDYGSEVTIDDIGLDLKTHDVRVGLAYKF